MSCFFVCLLTLTLVKIIVSQHDQCEYSNMSNRKAGKYYTNTISYYSSLNPFDSNFMNATWQPF